MTLPSVTGNNARSSEEQPPQDSLKDDIIPVPGHRQEVDGP